MAAAKANEEMLKRMQDLKAKNLSCCIAKNQAKKLVQDQDRPVGRTDRSGQSMFQCISSEAQAVG